MHRVGYSVENSSLFGKKSKIAHNFFVTKATYLITIFLKSPWKMDIETCVTLSYLLIKQKNYFFRFSEPFLAFFSTLPSTQTIKVIGLTFFNDLALANWAMHMHFNPIPKDVMQVKLFQKCTHLLYCSVLSLGNNVNTRRMLQPDIGSIFYIKKSMKYSGHRKLLCELSKWSNLMLFFSSDTKRTLMHLFFFTNSAQLEK